MGAAAENTRRGLFIVRLPGDEWAGSRCGSLMYNIDLSATVYDLAGITPPSEIHGQSVLPLLREKAGWHDREYVTCRYADSVCYIDDETWAIGDIDGNLLEIFDLNTDPDCMKPLGESEAEGRWKLAWDRLLSDAGGEFPDYRGLPKTDALGRSLE